MGRFVDVGKGDDRRPSDISKEEYLEKFEKIFGKDKVKAGSYKQDPETGKFISSYDWHVKYGRKVKRVHMVQGDIEAYESPVTNNVISTRRAQKYDLESTGNRIYEGREQEQKEANRHNADKEAKSDRLLEHRLRETAQQLRYQGIKPERRIKTSWLLGED